MASLAGTPFDTGIDLKVLEEPAQITRQIKEKYEKFETGYTGVSGDVFIHKVPGGMISNMVAQLKEAKRMDLMDAALKETPSVEKDLGHPPLLTPTSQIVGVQAVLNVLAGERYKIVTKETTDYVKGKYGRPPGVVNKDLVKKIMKDKEPDYSLRSGEMADPADWDKAIKDLGPLAKNDEDLLLGVLFPMQAKEFLTLREGGVRSNHRRGAIHRALRRKKQERFRLAARNAKLVKKFEDRRTVIVDFPFSIFVFPIMPEFPDVTVYIEALTERVLNQPIQKIRIGSPFVLRSFDPPISAAEGKKVFALRRLGKRIVFELEDDLFLIVHLMIAGRFHWKPKDAKIARKYGQAAFDFPNGTLLLTEAGTKKRASIHLVRGEAALQEHDPGGLEVLDASLDEFRQALTRENHTLKRSLTDPHVFSGIGNAYSDEILHRAKLSPIRLTQQMTDVEIERLYNGVRESLIDWVERLRKERGTGFPEKVTAFRPDMAVHGKYRKPCPVCGSPVQRIVHAENETNYCATCQTGGKLLADRSLSRLLKDDWPRSLEEMEEIKKARV